MRVPLLNDGKTSLVSPIGNMTGSATSFMAQDESSQVAGQSSAHASDDLRGASHGERDRAEGIGAQRFNGYLLALVSTALLLVIRLAIEPFASSMSPFLIFAPAVMVSAWYGGRGPGIFA